MGIIPNFPINYKLRSRSRLAGYIAMNSLKHIRFQLQNIHIAKVRNGDSHAIIVNKGPTKAHSHVFQVSKRLTVVTTVISAGTPPPVNISHAIIYPDAAQCKLAQDQALQKLQLEKW